jgi:hypothetical protein
MKISAPLALSLLACAAFAKENVAVLDIPNPSEQVTALSSYFADELCLRLSKDTAVSILERSQLSKVLGEQGIQASGAFDAATVSRIGKLTGASRIVTGRYYPVGDEYELVSRTVEVATGKLVNLEKVKFPRNESLVRLDATVLKAGLPTGTAPQPAASGLAPSQTQSKGGPITLKSCVFSINTVVCTGEIRTSEEGVLTLDEAGTWAYFDNGAKGSPAPYVEVAGIHNGKVASGVMQGFAFWLRPAYTDKLGAFQKFRLAYRLAGKDYVIDAPPALTRKD